MGRVCGRGCCSHSLLPLGTWWPEGLDERFLLPLTKMRIPHPRAAFGTSPQGEKGRETSRAFPSLSRLLRDTILGSFRLETIMTFEEIDPDLYGAWGEGGYCGGSPPPRPLAPEPDHRARHLAHELALELALEIKSAEALAAGSGLRSLMNEVTEELKEQLHLFQRLRRQAADTLDDPDGDHKLARADLKAATDAISLIVRTLDKTDELQRKIDDAGEADRARHVDDETLDRLCENLNRHIVERAEALARSRIADGSTPEERPPDDAPG